MKIDAREGIRAVPIPPRTENRHIVIQGHECSAQLLNVHGCA
jgi:hypothetical protein